MKKIIVVFCLLFAGIAHLSAAFTSVQIGDSSEYLIFHDANNLYKLHYEVQVDAGVFRIQVLATDPAHFGINFDSGVAYSWEDDYRAGFSWVCVRATGGNLTGGGIDGTGSGPNASLFSLRHSAGTASYGGYSYTVGDVLTLKMWKRIHLVSDGSWQYSEVVIGDVVLGTGTIYFVTFTLPENGTSARRDYFASQNGKVIDNTYQSAGSPSRSWRIGPLTSNASVSLSVITGGRIGWDAANGLAIVTDETVSTVVNPGVIPLVGTLTTGGGTGSGSDVSDSTPSVPSVLEPTLSTPTSGGGGLVSVPGTSGATTAATTGDISQVAAGIATGANGVITNATSNANGIIGAVNRSIAVLDKINATLESSKTGSFDDANIVAGLSSVKSSVDDFKTVTQAHWTAETTTLATAKTAAQADADSRANSISGNMAAAKDAAASSASTFTAVPGVASSLQLATVNPTPADNGWALQPYLLAVSDSVVMSGIAGGGGLDLNPFTSPQLANLIGTGTALIICIWIKSFITWAVVIAFLTWTFGQVKENVIAMMTVPQMALPGSTQLVSRTAVLGNSVGVIPAAGLYVFQQLALATFLLASPAITVAILMDTGSAGTLATTASTAAPHTSGTATGFCANALSCMFVVCPVATIITVFLNGLLVRIGSITQFIVTGVVTRTIGV